MSSHTRRTAAQVEVICQAIHDILEDQHPATVWSVFYQLVSLGLIDKTETEYKATACRLLTKMRRDGRIPYGWISDGTRLMRKGDSYRSMREALDATARFYRRAFWQSQPNYCEVWSEKDAITGTIFQVTNMNDVPLMITRGFSSLTFLHGAGATISEIGKPTTILHLGDHDLSCGDIACQIERELQVFAPYVPIAFVRLAVTPQQIRDLSLPTRPPNGTRSLGWPIPNRWTYFLATKTASLHRRPPSVVVSMPAAARKAHPTATHSPFVGHTMSPMPGSRRNGSLREADQLAPPLLDLSRNDRSPISTTARQYLIEGQLMSTACTDPKSVSRTNDRPPFDVTSDHVDVRPEALTSVAKTTQ